MNTLKKHKFYYFIAKVVKGKYTFILCSSLLLISVLVLVQFHIVKSFVETTKTEKPSDIEALRSLPYVSWSPIKEEDKTKIGVTKYNRNLSCRGFNLYNARGGNSACLMNMDGTIIHKWSTDTKDWTFVVLNENGDLFFIAVDKMLTKIDWNSNVIWENKSRFHHYIYLAENGDIYSLTRKRIKAPYKWWLMPILNDYITILSSDGKVKKEISIFKLFGGEIRKYRLDAIINGPKIEQTPSAEEDSLIDVFHTNSVGVINRDINGLCKKGDLLVSVRELNLIAIVDPKKEKVIWSWGKDDLDGQHNPILLENGNILIFDNGRHKRKYSRIIELNPITKKIEWEYKAEPLNSFYTQGSGACHKLPNGNILITESYNGRAFEVTKDGKTVWEFYAPIMKKYNKRAGIIDMDRLSNNKLKLLEKE